MADRKAKLKALSIEKYSTKDISDEVLSIVYEKYNNLLIDHEKVQMEHVENISKYNKFVYIGLDPILSTVDDENQLNKLYLYRFTLNRTLKQNSKNTPRQEIILQLINKMLDKCGKDPITSLSEFKLPREDFIEHINGTEFVDENAKLLDEASIKKKQLKFTRSTKVKHYSVILLESLAGLAGFKLVSKITSIYNKAEKASRSICMYTLQGC
jgi:hypothetical protein